MMNCVANQPFCLFAGKNASQQVSVNMVTPEIHNTSRPVAELFKGLGSECKARET